MAWTSRERVIAAIENREPDATYYGTHRGKKDLKWKDEPDFRPLPLAGK